MSSPTFISYSPIRGQKRTRRESESDQPHSPAKRARRRLRSVTPPTRRCEDCNAVLSEATKSQAKGCQRCRQLAHNKAKRARKNKSKLVVTVSITNVLVENLSPPLPPGPFTFTFPPNKPDLDCDLVHIASSSKITLESLGSIRKRSDLENFFNWSASKDESERESNEAHESDGDEHQFEQRDEYDSEGGYEHDSEEGIEP